MLLAHLHLRCRNSPFGTRKVKFGQFRMAQLAGTHKHPRSQTQGGPRNEAAGEALDGAEEGTSFFRVDNAGVMARAWCGQDVARIDVA